MYEQELLEAAKRAQADIDHIVRILEQQAGGQKPDVSRWLRALQDLEPDYPTGAWGMSARTARVVVNMSGGRPASEAVVRINKNRRVSSRPDDYWERLKQVAKEYDIPGAVVMAICCRESNQGAALDRDGEGDAGNGFGVMQVDRRYHKPRGSGDPYSLEHLRQGCAIFAEYRETVAKKRPDWEDKHVLKGAAVAFNSGPGNVVTIKAMDKGTTGNDYGADVMARAQYYLALS